MTRRTDWPEYTPSPDPSSASAPPWGAGASTGSQDGDGPAPSRAGAGPSRSPSTPGEQQSQKRQPGGPRSTRESRSREPQDPVERARAICLRLLTGTPRTRRQLADALRKRDVPEEAAEEVLARLENVGLVDDVAFAAAWVESRHHSRGLARRALARELRTKGVDATVIDEAVGELDAEQEEETARALVERKLRATRGLERDKRLRRLAGTLARKGYPEGLALRVVRQALEEEGEDPEELEEHFPGI
ncbi:recombination regulator RecX [Streptomyces reniochalinae]|uniref:Regulatory protein RecX n=1 Tax=Streptomyces reniochalinae TaxID=2250578 RepID=A0A367E6I2_9ACTN|nr:recombination regulator RecX [Streptomyces reniochalinae]RCG13392.1 recombination regulator RecX [Streptomyces reniochalinae]